jgi:hypothetical protein
VRIVGAVVGILVLCGGAIVLMTRGSHEAPRVRLPESFAGYQRLHNGTDASLRHRMANAVPMPGLGSAIFGHASIGAYGHDTGDQPALLVITMPRRSFRALGGGDDAHTVDVLLERATVAPAAYPAGPRGGLLRCGVVQDSEGAAEACAWADAATAGVAVVAYPPMNLVKAAGLTNALRSALR